VVTAFFHSYLTEAAHRFAVWIGRGEKGIYIGALDWDADMPVALLFAATTG
jgi:hypothetical protein